MAKLTFASSRPSQGLPITLGILLVLSLGLNLYLLFFCGDGDGDASADDDCAEAPDTLADEGGDTTTTPSDDHTPADAPATPIGAFENLESLDVAVTGSLSQTLDNAVEGRRSVWLTATTGRILVWCLDMGSDLRAGDQLQLLYEPQGEEEVTIAALQFNSQKKGKTYRAYHFIREGEKYGSYWDESGVEVPARFKETPIEEYEQITALLGDGRNHKGIDFMGETGTPVFAVKDATVLRTTWNFKYNGNSLELRYSDGVIARYLHLEGIEAGVNAGSKIAAGQQVATLGNTGRTSAPHLHYEVEKGGRITDPLDYHGTIHRTLTGADADAFKEMVGQYNEAMGGRLDD